MRRALIVVGKAPEPGRTKTRLVPPLTADTAAALYRGFLLDTVELGLALGWEQVSVVHPRGAQRVLGDLLPRPARLFEQRGVGLADALGSAFEHHFAQGFEQVVLIGSDNPTLPAEPIQEACAALAGSEAAPDLAIGPCFDGGYYLLGMRQPHLGVLDGIAWSTDRVYAQTLARAAELGLRVHPVAEWYDVDGPADLERLQLDLRASSPRVAPRTRAVLQGLIGQAA